jgi:glycosyltransferase involved in cell wall biosynthesis
LKSTFIAWTHNSRRSDLLAEHLGASMHRVSLGSSRGVLSAPIRYSAQTYCTWRILEQERPDLVLVQNPPIFCALTARLYARRHNARLIIDSHTGAFLSPRWRWSLPLHRVLSRAALATIVTNPALERKVRAWGATPFVLAHTPGKYPEGAPYPFAAGFNVAAVTTFDWDEPIDVLFAAGAALPTVNFYLTGDSRRVSSRLFAQKPANLHLTGYLPYERYVGLLRGANAVLDLTTQNHTLLMGGFEAVSLGTPLIVSDWPILRDYFTDGTVHVANTVESLRAGIERAQQEQASLRLGIVALQRRFEDEWEQRIAALRHLASEV